MTLNEASIICGLKVVPVVSEGEKAQLSLTFPELTPKIVKNKKTGDKETVVQSMAKRAISDVTRFFTNKASDETKLFLSETQLPTAHSVVAQAVKENGESPLDFYMGCQALIDSLEEEVSSVSAADPSNIMGQFIAALFTTEDSIPTPDNFLEVVNAKVADYFSSADSIKDTIDLLTEKENTLGRLESGVIRWRKPRTVKTEENKPAETPAELVGQE